ncbi:Aste57867_24836 [Aphanomyces stellatus]|uniref:Aste57867_24836 protein n=1 Tax=Aphanomyces stellatus TaxID=120398 RepID=A0A485LSY0_9STRA|nr:hypothetical protein As57867_024758 [Aphanomyces stellatus]VFU01471.1 Aste57867_24836 [Aphanomyces stellatus]
MKVVKQVAGMCVAAALMAAGSLCINASKVDGKMPYVSATVMFLVEVFKGLTCALVLLFCVQHPKPPLWIGWTETLYFAAPALLYTIDNNLTFVILRFVDPATLSILWNLKIFTTALLFRFVLRRSISHLQVVSLVLLMLGVITTQSRHDMMPSSPMMAHAANASMSAASRAAPADPKFMVGLGLVAIACAISSLAGIVTEYALKKSPQTPFVLQNLYMASFSMLFNGLAVAAQADELPAGGLLGGYNSWTWVVVVIQVFAGLTMGLILKFLDNIACVYTHAMAMMFTTLVSILFFAFDLTLEFACGFCVCVVSMYLYHLPVPGHNACHGDSDDDDEYEKLALARSPVTGSDTTLESPSSSHSIQVDQTDDGNDDGSPPVRSPRRTKAAGKVDTA